MTPLDNKIDRTCCRNMTEQRLALAAWRDPVTFMVQASLTRLLPHHIEDRLVDAILQYCLSCANTKEVPTAIRFEDFIESKAIPGGVEDFGRIFLETEIPTGLTMTDLISDVLELSEERAQIVTAEITVSHLRAVKHVQTCPACIRCCNGERRAQPTKKQSWRAVEYVAV